MGDNIDTVYKLCYQLSRVRPELASVPPVGVRCLFDNYFSKQSKRWKK